MTLECSSSSSSSSLPNGKHQCESSIGCLISLISNCGSRYEGVIDHLDLEDRSVRIRNVRCYGTKGRVENGIEIMPSNVVVEYMLFSRSQVKSLSVKRSGCLPRKPALECSSSSSSSSSLPNGIYQFESSIGCLISVISHCDSRYEGVIDHLDLEDRSVRIRNVTRNRLAIAPDMIFSRSEVKSLSVTGSGCLPRKPESTAHYKDELVGRSIIDSNHFPKLPGSNFVHLECSSSSSSLPNGRYQFESSIRYFKKHMMEQSKKKENMERSEGNCSSVGTTLGEEPVREEGTPVGKTPAPLAAPVLTRKSETNKMDKREMMHTLKLKYEEAKKQLLILERLIPKILDSGRKKSLQLYVDVMNQSRDMTGRVLGKFEEKEFPHILETVKNLKSTFLDRISNVNKMITKDKRKK